ncbi:MAG: transposase, partial [Sphingobacteriia bacterium]|nr:transposase [Sphingobacteriia bacterium]
MADEVLFSDRLYSDAWYSNLFSSGMTKDQAHLFKIQWIAECKRQGVKKIWLSIDGSNNNCQVQNSDLCEYGNGKKNEHLTLVSYIYAVDAHTGKPVTW